MLLEQIEAERLQATREGNEVVKSILTCVLSDAKNLAIFARREVNDDDVMSALKKWKKSLNDAIDSASNNQNAVDFILRSELELMVISKYIPVVVIRSGEEHEEIIDNIINSLDTNERKIGNIMKALKQFSNIDNKLASSIIKIKLG